MNNLKQVNEKLQQEAAKLREETNRQYMQYEQQMKLLQDAQAKTMEKMNIDIKKQNEEHQQSLKEIEEIHKETVQEMKKQQLLQYIESIKKEKLDKEEYYKEKCLIQNNEKIEYEKIRIEVEKEESRLKKI